LYVYYAIQIYIKNDAQNASKITQETDFAKNNGKNEIKKQRVKKRNKKRRNEGIGDVT